MSAYLRFGLKFLFGGLILAFVTWKVLAIVDNQAIFEVNFHLAAFSLFGLVVFLMFLNWSCEAAKWKVLMRLLQPLSFFAALKAVFAGIATGILTPNRLGVFIGRVAKLNPELRIKATVFTFYTSLIQFFISLFFGLFGILGLKQFIEPSLFWSIIICVVFALVLALLVLKNPLLLVRKPFVYLMTNEIKAGIDQLSSLDFRIKLQLLGWSALRYFIFVSQFVVVLVAFQQMSNSLVLYSGVMTVYLFMTLIPSLFLGKLFVREAAGLVVLAWIGIPDNIIILSGFLVWFINIALPALLGVGFLIQKR